MLNGGPQGVEVYNTGTLHIAQGGSVSSTQIPIIHDSSTLAVDGVLTAPQVYLYDSSMIAGSGTINITSGNLYQPGNGASTFAGTIAGSGGIDLAGGQLTLTGTSAFTGNTKVEGSGVLHIGTDNALPLGPTAGSVRVYGGAVLDLAGHALNVNGLGTDANGTIDNSNGIGALVVGNNNASSLYYGTFTNSGGTLNLTKAGTGTLTLDNGSANTYRGATTVNGGVLSAMTVAALSPNSAYSVNAGTLDVSAAGGTIKSLNLVNGGA